MKMDDDVPFREGVVLDRPVKKGCGSFVNVGMRKEVRIDRSIKPGVRVTVKMEDNSGVYTCTQMYVLWAEISWIYPLRFPKYYTITHLVMGDDG